MRKNIFQTVPTLKLPRSRFDLSHTYSTTFNEGEIIPVYLDEVYPGDSFNVNAAAFTRLLSPLTTPILSDMILDIHFFYVPLRLIWDNFEKQQGAQDNPGDSTDYADPWLYPGDDAAGMTFEQLSIYDYFGLPTKVNFGTTTNGEVIEKINAGPLRAYNRIWNEWYRDQDLQDSVFETRSDGPDDFNSYKVLRRNKKHDYFTSARPWPQKGPGVEIPLGDTAPVIGNGNTFGIGTPEWAATVPATSDSGIGATDTYTVVGPTTWGARTYQVSQDPEKSGLIADLSSATAATINSLRQAFAIQHIFERDAIGGTRFREILRAHWSVVSPDARLQVTEYLGGFSQKFIVNPVVQQSATDSVTPQGNLTAFAVSGASHHAFTKSFVEHGYILALASVRVPLLYQQGINKLWSRRSRFDRYMPALAHLGEQAILNKEIYASDDSEQNNGVFGYQERWNELRYHESKVTGALRSNYDGTLDFWHLGQNFENLPTLNSEFIQEQAPMDRVVAVTTEPDFVLDLSLNIQAARIMPTYSTPGLGGRF